MIGFQASQIYIIAYYSAFMMATNSCFTNIIVFCAFDSSNLLTSRCMTSSS